MNMNFNQLTAAAAAAAAGNPNSINISSFTNAISNLLGSSNIDFSQLGNLGMGLNFGNAALNTNNNNSNNNNSSPNVNTGNQQNHHQSQQNSSSNRSNLHQAHHHRSSSGVGGSSTASLNAALNSNPHIPSSIANLHNADNPIAAAAASLGLSGLPASLSNLTSTSLADLAVGAQHNLSQQHHQTSNSAGSTGRSSIQSAHHRSSSGSNHNHHQQQHHHLNHHHNNPSSHLTAAHQSSSNVSKTLAAAAAAHQQQSSNSIIHQRNSSTGPALAHNLHNSLNNNQNYPNNINNFNNILGNNNLTTITSSLSNNINNNLNSSLNNLAGNHNNSTGSGNILNNINNINLNNINNNNNNNNSSSANNNSSQIIIATNSTASPPKNSICYRIGDIIYFENSPSSGLQIGRIEEICKNQGDNVEVKVILFYRRRDIQSSLMTLADKYQYDESQEEEIKEMSEKDKATLKQRELFYSRSMETIPATSVRGKCTVQLLNESESLKSYISKDDHYFYTLVYDPQQKTITADRGEIRVGQRYQAEVQPSSIYNYQAGGDPADPFDLNELETLVYTPDHNLTDDDINKYLTIAKSVGTFARALDCSSSIKQPSLHLTAASASRDVTLLYAMNLLHQNNYDFGQAVRALVPSTGPVLCRDEIEEWTAGEATLFEEAIEKYGREFNDIRQDFLPWKSVKNIVEYYYMWKTTDRSINQRKMKTLEAENKVTVLYINDPEAEMKKSVNITPAAPSAEVSNLELTKIKAPKRPLEPEEPTLNTTTSMEISNASQKRRQVSEPRLSAHVSSCYSPGENLRFIATPQHKEQRSKLINYWQMRRLCRRPWERRTKPKT